jgi:hypothetical protein
MMKKLIFDMRKLQLLLCACALVLAAACSGGGGNDRDSGPQQTTLSVAASDPDGDALSYQWRATGGVIENRNASETVWTLPAGPGLHFAYVTVSDGKGGYAEQQYAASSDALGIAAPTQAAITRPEPVLSGADGVTGRLRLKYQGRSFVPAVGGTPVERFVYAPSVRVELRTAGATVFSGVSDESGEVQLPALPPGKYNVRCGTSLNSVLVDCSSFTLDASHAPTVDIQVTENIPSGNNLRLYGHIVLSDGSVCGARNDFAGIRSAGTVQVIDATGTAQSAQVEINRFGDYAIDAPVLVGAPHKLRVRCDSLNTILDIAAPSGFVGTAIELSASLPNSRPRIDKIVANGPEGNVRGRMVVAEANASSNSLPGPDQFLAYKGKDTRLGACLYYKSFGATEDCDEQGNLVKPLSLDDWKRKHQLQPYAAGNLEHKATYINKMDLNLVRRMSATQSSPNNIAFYVCNSPGPEGSTQREINEVIGTALAGEREVACVAMEWSVTQGVNSNKPFTKFLTFRPDGLLLLSVNLDGRGEKFMPGTCVACHGGTHYSGKFPDKYRTPASPFLGSSFLPFDTGNYAFSTDNSLRKPDQQAAIMELNKLVAATERDVVGPSPIVNLINGWYQVDKSTLNEAYVPDEWKKLERGDSPYPTARPGATRLYREVVGTSCRTCHSAFKNFDWDSNPSRIIVPAGSASRNDHVCGGSRDLIVNASMPNALISRDRVIERVNSDPSLAALMKEFFGCTSRLPDPAHDRR